MLTSVFLFPCTEWICFLLTGFWYSNTWGNPMYESKLHRVCISSYQSSSMAQGMWNLFITLHSPCIALHFVWTWAFCCLSLQFTIVLLLRHLVMVGAANQFAFSLLTVSSPTLPEWMNECFFDSHGNLNFFLGLEWKVYLLWASRILLPFLRCHEAHLRDPVGTEAVSPAAAPG